MTKPNHDAEIDLVELIQIFYQHSVKFIVMGFLGLILGLSFSFYHESIYSTDFKFYLSHNSLYKSILNSSALIQSKIDYSKLNSHVMPHYSFNKKTNTFTVKSFATDIQPNIESLLRTSLANELEKIKTEAAAYKGYPLSQILLNINDELQVHYTNQDLANLNIDAILSTLKINFSETKLIYPNPFKHGLIGVFIGLILGFVWMILAILIGTLNLKKPRRKT